MASLRIRQCLFGILCLFSTLSIAGGIEMFTDSKILATCGQNVTLKCDIIAKDAIEISQLFWMEKKEICDYMAPLEDQVGAGFECVGLTYTKPVGKIFNYSLTLFNLQPEHKGTYHCKLRSKAGVANGQTIVRVQKCVGNTSTHVSPTEGTCTFKDVYPEPIIRWNQGYENLTDLAETEVTKSDKGLFTAVSKIKLKKDPSIPYNYNCTLWMSVDTEKNETQVQWVKSRNFSGGHKLIGHWFAVMLAMVLGVLLA